MSRWMATGAALAVAVLLVLAAPTAAHAHCDTMDGPVVKAAQTALESGSVEHALIWVQPEHEPEVRDVFDRVRGVRSAGGDAAALADRFFLETVVRLHREGEGEPYTGLKPAGTSTTPAVAQADAALEAGSVTALRHHLHDLLVERLDEAFAHATRQRQHLLHEPGAGAVDGAAHVRETAGTLEGAAHVRDTAGPGAAPNVAAGREFVTAYVHYMHLVEALEAVLSGHGHAPAESPVGHGPHGH